MTEPGMQSDRKSDEVQVSIIHVLRDMGRYSLPVVLLFTAIILSWATKSPVSYNAPNLNLALYFIFSLLMPLLIIILGSRIFFITGDLGLLMLGCGVVIWSCSGVPALFLAKSDPNITFTIYNSCLWLSALCHLVGAIASLRLRQRLRFTGLWLTGVYFCALCCIGLIIYSTLAGWTPTFFIKGQGGTLLRQWVLGSAVVMFVLSAVLVKAPSRRPSALLNWYALALLLIATGLVGFLLQSSIVNDMLTWASRTALFLSGVYMLTAAIASFRETHRRLYNELLNLAVDGIVMHDFISETKGYFTEVNPAICTMLGYTQEEMRKLTPLDIIIPEDRKSAAQDAEIMIHDKVLRHTKTLLTKDGRHIAAEISTRLYEDQGRQMVLSIIRDITERTRYEEELRQSERRERERAKELTAILDAVPTPVVIVHDPDSTHMTGNRAADELLKQPRGVEVSLSAPPEVKPRHFRAMKDGRELSLDELPAQRAARGEYVKDFEFSLVFDDGATLHLLGYGTPLLDGQGHSRGAVHGLVDITGRKLVEDNVRKLSNDLAIRNQELEIANKELESFVYSIFHDLQGPLRTMSTFVSQLFKNYSARLDDQAKEYITRISRSSAKMNDLVNDLLDLSRLSRQEVNRAEVNMSALANAIICELRMADPDRNVDISIEDGLTASADPPLTEIIFSNLIGNAWKFSSKTANARIEVGAVEKDGKTVYYVRDNGAGFDPQYAAKMFQPFHRLHSDEEFEGTGIGLTIVERIIHRHGGKIWAEGEVGKGATFNFTL